MKYFLFLVTLFSSHIFGQEIYNGTIGEYKVELVLSVDGDYVSGVYLYKNHNVPLELSGSVENKILSLTEEKNGRKSGLFTFNSKDLDSDQLSGTWTDLRTKNKLPVILIKNLDSPKEILQTEHSGDYYFKVLDLENTSALNIYNSKTNKLVQSIEDWCGNLQTNSISVEDYNFDGIPDFSGCMQSYAGPNTSKTYYLFDSKSGKFIESDFTGTSLEFDSVHKKIYETNQCCAGASIQKNVYKVKNNQMILLEEHCYKRDDRSGNLIERKPKDCK